MDYHFIELVRKASLGVCLAVVCGGFTACTDDYDLDDEGNYPSWLGGSIYEALKNPGSLQSSGKQKLTGTFTNYVRLIDDLGYAETLNKTGSMTVFPANDEAFERFFANNKWGVTRYEDLTIAMKKQLLYTSMLKNAMLVEMLSNVSDLTDSENPKVEMGQAMKHETAVSVIDTITFLKGQDQMPANNPYWEEYYDDGLYIVSDATSPMLLHFTEEHMTKNAITTTSRDGVPSDFEVITGTPYDDQEHSAYVFRDKIINADVTCQNGYIHQVENLLVPPGNMAEVLRTNDETKLFSRMLERFAAPYKNTSVTRTYNTYALANNLQPQDITIYEKRYFSSRSQDGKVETTPSEGPAPAKLPYDPGWNAYNDGTQGSDPISNVAAMFVPTDQALWDFFKPGGQGSFLIEQFGKLPNELDNLPQNLDSIPLDNVSSIVGNLMMRSFVNSVPSKFENVMDEASDPMGLTYDVLNKTAEGKYDVKIANNGVIYMLNKMFAPPSLICVSAPVKLKDNMLVMREAVYDGDSKYHTVLGLNQNFYVYLLAMSANYGFFIPTDDAFENYYINPCYMGEEDQARAFKFTPITKSPYLKCEAYKYDKTTGTVGELLSELDMTNADKKKEVQALLVDILNTHTIVLGKDEELGTNKYYKTKNGATIRVDFAPGDSTVMSGSQIAYRQPATMVSVPASKVKATYAQANGKAYAIDHVIQPSFESVYSVLSSQSQLSDFFKLCDDADMPDLLSFASDKLMVGTGGTNETKTPADAYYPFKTAGMDYDVSYFQSYNYTVYAPDNTAMQEAFDRGLPSWDDVRVIYNQHKDVLQAIRDGETVDAEQEKALQVARDKVLAMVNEINNFIRYHFQDNSIYADNVVSGGSYPTACSDSLGISQALRVSGGGGQLTVSDNLGQTISIDANNTQKLVNKMTRDYVFQKKENKTTGDVTKILQSSSFAVVHQISKPFSVHNTNRYDGLWSGSNARQKLADYRKQFETRLYKLYQK